MDKICTFDQLFQMEQLVFNLQTHCYALNLLVQVEEEKPAYWFRLLADQVEYLDKTCTAFLSLEDSIENGCDSAPLTPAAASDTPSA